MSEAATIAFDPFRLDLRNQCLLRGTDSIALTPKAFAVLEHLARRPDQLVTKNDLLDAVWPDTHVSDAVLKVVISEVRKVLGDDPKEPRFIATVHRRGYRFVARAATAMREFADAPATAARELVGRDEELTRLQQWLRRAVSGERQVVFVTGEGGIGKTALVDAFAATLPELGVGSARGQCLEHHGSGEAYLPLLEALGDLCRGPVGKALVPLLRQIAPSWVAQMPWLLHEGDDAHVKRTGATASRESMQREMADLLEVFTDAHPLVLILEDLHWSDVSSVDLLSRLAHRRSRARLLVLATYRPVDLILQQHPLKALKQRLDQQRLCGELRLPYLGAADVARYLERRFEGRTLQAALAETIAERSGGNPLFVVNLVDDLVARGWLAVDSGMIRAAIDIERIRAEVPDGVRQMIEVQVERLPAEHAKHLEAASAVGDEFSTAAVAAALERPVDEIERFCESEPHQLRYLEAHGVIALGNGNIVGRYRFAHALYRDVFYQRIGRARRMVLHRRIGEWLESEGGSAAELARHFLEAVDAGCTDKAVRYSRLAAERAAELFAYTEAAAHYQTALDVLFSSDPGVDRRDEECRVCLALGETLERSGSVALAGEAFTRAAAIARDLGSAELLARAALGRGRGHHPVNAADPELIALLEEALQRIGTEPGPLRARLLARLDTALSPTPGAHERREAMAREALDYARCHDDPETYLLVMQYTRWAFNGRESPDQLQASVDTLARYATNADSREDALQFQLLRLTQLHELGAADVAAAALERFAESADVSGVLWFQWFAQRLRAYRALEEGRFRDAEHDMQEALAIGQRTDHPNVMPTFGAQRIALHLQQGRFDEIEPQLAAISGRHPEQFTTRAALAYVRAQLGDVTGSRRELDALAVEEFGRIPRDSLWLMVLARLIEVCVEVGDRTHAEKLGQLFAPYAERVIGAGAAFASVGHGSRYLALLAYLRGDWQGGIQEGERAVEVHRRMGARPWLAQSLFELGRLLLRSPCDTKSRTAMRRRGTAAIDQARGLADDLGMQGLASAIQRLET